MLNQKMEIKESDNETIKMVKVDRNRMYATLMKLQNIERKAYNAGSFTPYTDRKAIIVLEAAIHELDTFVSEMEVKA